MRRALCIVSALVLSACAQKSSLSVQVVSDLLAPGEVDRATVDVTRDGAPIDHVEADLDAMHALARPRRLAIESELPPGTYMIHVALAHGGTTLVERDARVRVEGPSSVTVLMTRDCVGVTCPGASGAPGELACLGARCVPPECDEDHPETCSHRECTVDADCAPSGIACASSVCSASGVCWAMPDDTRCTGAQICDGRTGCVDPRPGGPVAPILFVWNGMATGSGTRADEDPPPNDPLTPTVHWTSVPGAGSYLVDIDDSCDPNTYVSCGLGSPEAGAIVTTHTYTPSAPLFVPTHEETSRRFYVSLAACTGTNGEPPCTYARTRYIDVGRTIGDMDDDGHAEIVAGTQMGASYGYVVISGATLTPMADPVLFATGPEDIVAVGDVDRDRRDDFLVGSPIDGASALLLGAEGLAPIQFEGGHVGRAGDCDSDGFADFALGFPDDGDGSVVIHYGAATHPGSATATIRSGVPGTTSFGSAVAGADVNLDGFSDLVIAGSVLGHVSFEVFLAYNYQRSLYFESGFVSEIASTARTPFVSLSGGGDMDGDGYPDVFAALPTVGAAGIVTHHRYGERTIDALTYATGGFGESIATGPLATDGTWLAMIGAPRLRASAMNDYGGAVRCGAIPDASVTTADDVQFITSTECCGGGSLGGTSLAVADVNGDGWSDVIFGAPGSDALSIQYGDPSGSVQVVTGPAAPHVIGHALQR